MNAPQKTVILVAGPTAVGKTALAIRLAEYFKTAVLSADSRQCYRELTIGVARPTPAELQAVPHYFIATHSITQPVNAANFEAYALETTQQIFAEHDVLILTGGTGLYIKAFLEGLDAIPPVPGSIRTSVREQYLQKGLVWLQNEVRIKDPSWYAVGEVQNPQRLLRALEVVETTGTSIREFQGVTSGPRDFRVVKLGMELLPSELYRRIDGRVDQMMDRGLLEEVKELLSFRSEKVLNTVGYKELLAYLEGDIDLRMAVDLIKQHTRNYAKRQSTWFRKEPDLVWFNADDPDKVLEYLRSFFTSSPK